MSEELKPGQMRLFDRVVPAWKVGKYSLYTKQAVGEPAPSDTAPAPPRMLYAKGTTLADGDGVCFEVGGPPELQGDDVIVAYPSPGCEDAADLMLPHLVLRRRTLPWERNANIAGSDDTYPWVVLLLFDDDDLWGYMTKDGELLIAPALLNTILPKKEELPFLCHVRELCRTDRDARNDDDGFVAIVIGSRLPAKGRKHFCCLVSVEQAFAAPNQVTNLVHTKPLYSWTFTSAADGGDFESVVRGVCFQKERDSNGQSVTRPNGVTRFAENDFGHVRLDLGSRLGGNEEVWYRGPLAPVPLRRDVSPAAPQDFTDSDAVAAWQKACAQTVARTADDALEMTEQGELVVSYAAAFELGRLLALGSAESLAQLQDVRERESEVIRQVAVRNLLAIPWGMNGLPGLEGNFDNLRDMIGNTLGSLINDLRTGKGLDPVINWGQDGPFADRSGIRDLQQVNLLERQALNVVEISETQLSSMQPKSFMALELDALEANFNFIAGPVLNRTRGR